MIDGLFQDEDMTLEELEKKIEKINKQQNAYNRKVIDCTTKLRATTYGQDRYKRRYWVLPTSGGIFVEGLESAELEAEPEVAMETEDVNEENKDESKAVAKDEEKDIKEEDKDIKEEDKDIKEEDREMRENGKELREDGKAVKDKDLKGDKEVKATMNGIREDNLIGNIDRKVVVQENGEAMFGEESEAKLKEELLPPDTDQSKLPCVKVELNGKRNDEAMVVENGDIKQEGSTETKVKTDVKDKHSPVMKKEKVDPDEKTFKRSDEVNDLVNGVTDSSAFKVPSTNLFLQKSESAGRMLDLFAGASSQLSADPLSTPPHNIFKNTYNNYRIPNSHADIAQSFRSIDSILGSPDHRSTPTSTSASSSFYNNSFMSPPGIMSSTPVSAEQMLKNLSHRNSQDTWFSIIPRMPCDETSITRCPTSTVSSRENMAAPYSPSPCGAYSSPYMYGGQMASIRGSPIDFALSNMSQSSVCSDKSPYTSFNLSGTVTPSAGGDFPSNMSENGAASDNNQHAEPQPIKKGLFPLVSDATLTLLGS